MLTDKDILGKIKNVTYHVFEGTTVTVALVELENGYHVIGESACLDIKDFNVTTGQKWALDDAVDKIWQLEGYLVKEKMKK